MAPEAGPIKLKPTLTGLKKMDLLGTSNIEGFPEHIAQGKSNECAVASLQWIYERFGIDSNYDSVKSGLTFGKRGVDLLQISKHLESHGFSSYACQSGIEHLKQASGNLIALVHPHHFVVVIDYTPGTGFRIMDPAFGMLVLPQFLMRFWFCGKSLLVSNGSAQ